MVIRKTMSNLEIYNTANILAEAFGADTVNLQLPVKVNFFLQKNMKTVMDMAQEVDKTRIEIVQKYGSPSDEDPERYVINDMENASKELEDLFNLEQEVKINAIELDWFNDLEMSFQQMNAIAFMIAEEEEE